jgi:hypothetical protein
MVVFTITNGSISFFKGASELRGQGCKGEKKEMPAVRPAGIKILWICQIWKLSSLHLQHLDLTNVSLD